MTKRQHRLSLNYITHEIMRRFNQVPFLLLLPFLFFLLLDVVDERCRWRENRFILGVGRGDGGAVGSVLAFLLNFGLCWRMETCQ